MAPTHAGDMDSLVGCHVNTKESTGSPSSKYVVYATAYVYRELYVKSRIVKTNCVNKASNCNDANFSAMIGKCGKIKVQHSVNQYKFKESWYNIKLNVRLPLCILYIFLFCSHYTCRCLSKSIFFVSVYTIIHVLLSLFTKISSMYTSVTQK